METVGFFTAPGVRLAADLYLPDEAPPPGGYPSVVACLGWGSVRELMASWGETLAGLGYAVLVADYRGFGGSDGERGRCFPQEHVDDIGASLTFLSERPETDSERLALLGVSYGGAIAVATGGVDHLPRAVVSVVGYGSGRRHLQAVRTEEQWQDFETRLRKDRARRVSTGHSEEIDPDDILLRDAEAQAWRREIETRFPHMAFRTTLESAEKLISFTPERDLPFPSGAAALFIHAGDDTMVPVSESIAMYERADEPRKLVVIPDVGHHQVHDGAAFQRVIAETDAWFSEHLSTG